MEIKDKAALITGGARIGQAVAEALARRGCDVALLYNNSQSAAQESEKKIKQAGRRAFILQADVRQAADLEKTVHKVVKNLGRLDFLVNMASLYEKTPLARLESPEPDGLLNRVKPWQENMDVNVRSAYWLALKAAPIMRKGGGGRIVNVTDWVAASHRPRYKSYLPYYVSKVGMVGLTEALALEMAPDILVNAVAPGPMVRPKGWDAGMDDEVVKNTPLGRWGGAEEIAKAVIYFLEADFTTGETLRVDGGRHLL